MNKPYALSLPEELMHRVDAAAAADDRSRSSFARRALEKALADHAATERAAYRYFEELQK